MNGYFHKVHTNVVLISAPETSYRMYDIYYNHYKYDMYPYRSRYDSLLWDCNVIPEGEQRLSLISGNRIRALIWGRNVKIAQRETLPLQIWPVEGLAPWCSGWHQWRWRWSSGGGSNGFYKTTPSCWQLLGHGGSIEMLNKTCLSSPPTATDHQVGE